MKYLQDTLNEDFGKQTIRNVAIPEYIRQNLNRKLRPYQEDCLRYFLMYMDPGTSFDAKVAPYELLFHMATGSGKTLVMAACILHLYTQGYRNFLFTVGSTNIVEKTRDNFFNQSSSKYLFGSQIVIKDSNVKVKEVTNFQESDPDCINLCLSTVQGLWSDFYNVKENKVSIEDFANEPVVIIADEAHHLNSSTKKGHSSGPAFDFGDPAFNEYADEETRDWETTVMRIFQQDNGKKPNVLLEYTATMDFKDVNIANKYDNKVIFEYPLSDFCQQGFSKQVAAMVSDLNPMDRSLQAIIVSQYKKKLFASVKLNVKPVVMFKSKTIAESKKNFAAFHHMVSNLHTGDIERIRSRASYVVKDAFVWMDSHQISDENLILELKEDFGSERSLRIDGSTISVSDQKLVNTLESKDNHIRTIFAVDKLDEGWDVLNLFDIVRLNEPKGSGKGKPNAVTNKEAQLIGRGARYMPFKDSMHPELPADKRKFDFDGDNPLHSIETLHYHCNNRNAYIEDLNHALQAIGMRFKNDTKQVVERTIKLKDQFMATELWKKGYVYTNIRKPIAELIDDGTIGNDISGRTFSVSMPTGKLKAGLLFGDNQPDYVLTTTTISANFINLGVHVARAALNSFPSFHFDRLKKAYPSLQSITEFISSDKYLKALTLRVTGRETNLDAYSQRDKLYIAKEIVRQLEPLVLKRTRNYRGSTEFKPASIRSTFKPVVVYHFAVTPDSSRKEEVHSMMESVNPRFRMDLTKADWYAYDDCYGTSEEKSLVRYIEGKMDVFKNKYDSIWLVRNELDVHLYAFEDGRKFEPDFILFLKEKNQGICDSIQIFIEPKGEHLISKDKWKEDFLMSIHEKAQILLKNGDFTIWGLPFYNEKMRMSIFEEHLDNIIDDDR